MSCPTKFASHKDAASLEERMRAGGEVGSEAVTDAVAMAVAPSVAVTVSLVAIVRVVDVVVRGLTYRMEV